MGAQTQHKARPQVGRPNATQGTFASWAPQRNARHVHKLGAKTHVRKMGAQTQRKECPQDGRPNAKQGTSASWAPQRNARHVRKLGTPTHVRNANTRPVRKLGTQKQGTSARWAPKRNTRHVRKLGAPTQRKARPQVGRPNAHPQCKRKARPHVRKLGTPTQHKARPQDGRPNAKLIRNENVHTREQDGLNEKLIRNENVHTRGWIRTNFGLEVDFLIRPHKVGRPNATQGTSARWAPKRNTRHIRKCGAPMQRKARPQVGRPNALPHVRKLGAPMQRKARPQDGHPNATQGASARWAPKRKTDPQRKRPHKGALG
jgi:hypothetical protein